MNEQRPDTANAHDQAPSTAPQGYVAPPAFATGTPTVGLGALQQQRRPGPRTVADLIRRAEFWLNKVGIVLFLFGVVFLFQQAIARNWLDEAQRLAVGGVLGVVLLGWGLAIHSRMRHFSQVLMGGGIATLYITAFCSYVLFTSLKVPYELAFGAMATVTALAFVLSLWGDDVALALVGVLGGLLTPFVLGFSHIDTSPLMIYARLLLIAAGGIYLFRGWRSLLWTSAFGATVLLYWGLSYASGIEIRTPLNNFGNITAEIDIQLTILIAMLAFWVVPVVHELLAWHRPALFRKPSVPRLADASIRPVLDWHLYIMPVMSAFFGLAYSAYTWGNLVPQAAWGLITIVLGAGCVVASHFIRDQHGALASLHKWLGIALVTMGLFLVSGAYWLWDGYGSLLLLTMALQATIMHVVAARNRDRIMSTLAHCLFIISGLWLLGRLLTPPWGQHISSDLLSFPFAAASTPVLIDLAVIGLIFAASLLMRKVEVRLLYQVSAQIGTLLWVWRETAGLSFDLRMNYTMLIVALYATILLLTNHRGGRTESTPQNEWGQALAHILFVIAGTWVLGRIAWGLITVNPDGTPILNPRGLTDLGVILLAAICAFVLRYEPDRRALLLYGLGLHLAFLGWSWQEVGLMQSGNGFVTIVWGIYSLALIGSALYFMWRANDGKAMDDGRATPGGWLALLSAPRVVALALGLMTLFIVAGKLFLVDLRYLDAPWRILLFLGFGALFLLISHGFGLMTRRSED